MNSLEERAYAKLNLSLDVLGLLPDGYHEMKTVMQTAGLWDAVQLRLLPQGEIRVQSNFGFLPRDERNIAWRAATAFFTAAQLPRTGVEIRLDKHIPVGAGLGGGSADAAAVLRGLNRLCGRPLSWAQLEALGAGLGSDVPFCLRGGCRLGLGRGEQLHPAPPMPDCGILICKPRFSIRTPDLFRRIDSRRSRIHPDTEGLLRAMQAGELEGMARRMYNVFEDVLEPRRFSQIASIKAALIDCGALGASMSGSGPSVFGLFSSPDAAQAAAMRLRETYQDVFLCGPAAPEV